MSLLRRLRVLKVLQDRPGLRLSARDIADHADLGHTAIDVELASLVSDGWVESDHEDGSPRLYWLRLP